MSKKLEIYALNGNRAGELILTLRSEQEITFGRKSEASDFNLADLVAETHRTEISRTHFEIFFQGKYFHLKDLKSTNGTYIFNHRLSPEKPKVLCDGDIIKIGDDDILKLEVKEIIKQTDDATHQPPQPISAALKPIRDRLNERFDTFLLGPAGCGKTTILNELSPRTQNFNTFLLPEHRFCIFCYIDCLGVDTSSSISLFDEMLNTLQSLLEMNNALLDQQRRNHNLLIQTNRTLYQICQMLLQCVQEIYERFDKGVVFVLDHFDNVYQDLDEQVFTKLNELKARSEPTVLFLLAAHNEFDRFEYEAQQFLRRLSADRYYWIPEFPQKLLDSLANHCDKDPATTEFIRHLGGGRPHLTQLVDQAFCKLIPRPETQDEQIKQLLQHRQIENHCLEIWLSLHPDEQAILEKGFSSGPILPNLLASLVKKRILNEDQSFVSPLFASFVRRESPTACGSRRHPTPLRRTAERIPAQRTNGCTQSHPTRGPPLPLPTPQSHFLQGSNSSQGLAGRSGL